MISRKKVAEKSGVSQATVTNVFNKSKYVSPEIRERVLQAAHELGYRDSTVLEFVLLVKDADNPHNGMILSGMKEAADKFGAEVSMVLLDGNADKTVENLISRKVAGVFAAVSADALSLDAQKKFTENGIGFSSSWSDFLLDFDEAIEHMVSYLANLGHSRIAYLSGISLEGVDNLRYQCFCEALNKLNISVHKDLIVDGAFPYCTDVASGYQAMKKLLSYTTDFTAVCAINDLMALGAVRALQEAGLSVPNDVSVVGCDNIRLGEYTSPPLTTLDIPAREMGCQIIYTLLQKSKGIQTQKIHLTPQLILRKSTGLAK